MSSIYETPIDPDAENNSHSYILSFVGHNKSVLEVGCSSGYLTKVMAERGCDVIGIEVDPDMAHIAEEWAERVVVGNIDDGDVWNYVKDESFDVVLLGDVLEHLRDPLGSLRQAVKKLKPSGYVVTSLPNVAHGDVRLSLLLGRFPYADKGLLDRTHVRFFTAETSRQLHAEAGLLVVDTKHVVVPLFGTELGVQRGDVDSRIVDEILTDPEAETYQIVMKSVRDNGTQALAELSGRFDELSEQLHYENVRAALVRRDMRDNAYLEHQTEEQQRYIDALKGHVSGLEHNIDVLHEALQQCDRARAAAEANYRAVLESKTLLFRARLRRLQAKLVRPKRS